MMYTFEENHYKINRILLLIIGVWPYERSMLAKAQKFIVSCLLASSICIQFATFTTHEFSASLLIDILSYIFPIFVVVIKYFYIHINTGIVKHLLERIQADWNLIKDEHEYEIIVSYAENGKLFTTALTLLSCSVIFLYVTMPIAPYIINIYLSYNNTYSHYMYIPLEYSVDEEKYFSVILLHFVLLLSIALTVTLAIGTLIALCLKHACSLLKIARFTNYVMSGFALMYVLLIIIGAISTSINMFRLLRSLEITCDWREIFITMVVLLAHFLYMYFAASVTQEISDHCDDLFLASYRSMWYLAPLRIQRLILFLLQHGTKTYSIVVGGVFVGSLEGFATLMSSSLSYFMVIYSTQMR